MTDNDEKINFYERAKYVVSKLYDDCPVEKATAISQISVAYSLLALVEQLELVNVGIENLIEEARYSNTLR